MTRYRTLIRVEQVDPALVIIPGWDASQPVIVDLPADINERIKAGHRRFHATVNLDAENATDLVIKDWELT